MMKHRRLVGLIAVTLAVAVSGAAFAQPGNRGGRQGRGGMMGGGMGEVGLLMDEGIRKEVGVTDDQVETLRALQEKMMQDMRESFSGMRDLSQEDRQARMGEMRGKMEEMRSNLDGKVKDVLLPQQWDRLKQLNLQSQMQRQGLAGDQIAETLGLTEDQKTKLQEKARQVNQKLQDKINKLREEAKNEVLSVLTSEQQAKLKELTGEKYEFSRGQGTQQFDRGQRGQRGQRGGR